MDERTARAPALCTVLLADDDRSIRAVLSKAFARAGRRVRATGSVSQLWRWIEEGEGDVVLTDVMMPDGDALDMLPAAKRRRSQLPIIVMSAQNTVMTAIRAAEAGAYDYVAKPFDLRELIQLVGRALDARQGADQPDGAPEEPAQADDGAPLIGRSPAMQEVYRLLARLMHTELSVMITGESGTGKELIARALHNFGRRKSGPFEAVNMAAMPRELIESELFGHEKGAFTGAIERNSGCFERARGGTLFLDEIGDMPPEAQTRLLRVLQEGEFIPVGGRRAIRADVRIIAATHQDLPSLIRASLFREDLYYRLNVAPLRLPPLRERSDDIPDLARRFLRQAEDAGLGAKTMSAEALGRLQQYSWPGNVRELENLIMRLAALYPEDVIDLAAVENEMAGPAGLAPPRIGGGEPGGLASAVEQHVSMVFRNAGDAVPNDLYEEVLREIELPLIAVTLSAARGNQLRAAEILGINRNTLRKKIRELDIPVTRGKKMM